jgi:hypothetical protein
MYLVEGAAVRSNTLPAISPYRGRRTSNQMFARVREFLERTARGEVCCGTRPFSAEFELLRNRAPAPIPSAIDQDEADKGESARVFAAEWFTSRKRGLLAPYGIGTIDQALIAVLKTRHFLCECSVSRLSATHVAQCHRMPTLPLATCNAAKTAPIRSRRRTLPA